MDFQTGFYLRTGKTVWILAIVHGHREPEHWIDRKRNTSQQSAPGNSTMTTFRKTAVLISTACLLIGAAMYLVRPVPRLPVLPLSLTFIGLTNGPAREPVAVFAVSNSNDRAISFFAALPQVCETGVWERYIVRPPPALGTALAARQQTQFSVAVPSNGEAWKVPVLWSFGPTSGDRVRAVFRDNWLALRDLRSLPGLHVHIGLAGQTNYTAAIQR